MVEEDTIPGYLALFGVYVWNAAVVLLERHSGLQRDTCEKVHVTKSETGDCPVCPAIRVNFNGSGSSRP